MKEPSLVELAMARREAEQGIPPPQRYYRKFTERQKEVLEAIRVLTRVRGRSPTLRELGAALHASDDATRGRLVALRHHGAVTLEPIRVAP